MSWEDIIKVGYSTKDGVRGGGDTPQSLGPHDEEKEPSPKNKIMITQGDTSKFPNKEFDYNVVKRLRDDLGRLNNSMRNLHGDTNLEILEALANKADYDADYMEFLTRAGGFIEIMYNRLEKEIESNEPWDW